MPSLLWHCWLGVRQSSRPEKNLSDEVLVWLPVWSEVQIVCLWSSWCHCHSQAPSSGFTCLVPTYPGCPGKEAVKRVCVFCSILAQDLGTPEGSAGLSKCGEGRVWHNAVFGSRYKPTRWLEWADQAGQKHTPLHHTKNVLLLLSLRSCIKPLLTSQYDCELSKTAGARYSTV